MDNLKSYIETLQSYPRSVAWVGALSGWVGFDWLQAAQFTAAVLACMVSLCALILTGPQAYAKVIERVRFWRSKR